MNIIYIGMMQGHDALICMWMLYEVKIGIAFIIGLKVIRILTLLVHEVIA